mgnify:CR=1 FL=1
MTNSEANRSVFGMGLSPLTNTIYVGHTREDGKDLDNKQDVTQMACKLVAMRLMSMESKTFRYQTKDSSIELKLTVQIIEKNED